MWALVQGIGIKKYLKLSILYSGEVSKVRVWGKVIGGDEFDNKITTLT